MKKLIALVLSVLLPFTCLAGAKRYDASVLGPMTDESLAATYDELASAPGPEVTLRINSPGGDSLATLLFIELVGDLKAQKGLHITCIGSTMVASAAAVLMESKVCDVRVLKPETVWLFHNGSLGEVSGKAERIEDELVLLRALNRAMASIIAPRIAMTVDEYLAWVGDRDRWLTPDVCQELGIVDRVGDR